MRWKPLLLLVALAVASSANAEDQKVIVFWRTVSPNGKYALAWTKTGSIAPDDMPPPDEEGDVQNWLMELDSRKLMLVLPHAAYWVLPNGNRPNHFDMDTVWSDDSSSLLVVIDSRWTTYHVFLVNPRQRQARDLTEPMERTVDRILRREGGNTYRKQAERYAVTFSSPWFVSRDRFDIFAYAAIPKAAEGDFSYSLTFSLNSGGNGISLERASVSEPEVGESSDRQLNREYRSLIGLLRPAEREALVQEERAWIIQRDATNGTEAKEKLVKARIADLSQRRDNRVEELDSAQTVTGNQ
jgi:hypothetical protein